MPRWSRLPYLTLFLVFAVSAAASAAHAQTWPNRTVRIVVPYAPGGGVSVLAQILGTKLSEIVKQPVVIDNRPGAGGNLGSDAVAKSAPDGYTILLHTSALASAPALYKTLPFDVVKDFAPVTMVIATQLLVGGSPKNPATTLRELIAQAKARPGTLNYASSGPGSSLHLFAELLKTAAGIDLQHIPYRGDAPMITALIGGDVQLAFLPQATGGAAIRAAPSAGLP
jgi:tripartite-type tricarboxylate transporter receptor subunit TctC